MKENERFRLYIPTQIERRFVFAPGFGIKEALISTGVGLVAIVFSKLFLTIYQGTALVCILSGMVGMSVRKDDINRSISDEIKNIIKFQNSQKEYKFVWYNRFLD